MKTRSGILFLLLSVATLVTLVLDIAVGSVCLPVSDVIGALTGADVDPSTAKIVVDIRLVKALVAILAGIGLTVSGLQMQTLFRNPLAGPYVLGISSGASLAVALFVLGAPILGIAGSFAPLGMALTACIGSAAVLAMIAVVGRRVKDIMVLLILGMMISAAVGAVVQILQYVSSDEALKNFVIWTMGSLGNVTASQLPVLAAAVILGLILAVASIKPLNLLLLGEDYASTMGMNLRRSRTLIFASTALLAGSVTAFCGPIGFIGLALPHVARTLFRSSDHRVVLPGAALIGIVVMLGCDIVCKLFNLPVNAVTALVGIPIVIWIVMRNKSMSV